MGLEVFRQILTDEHYRWPTSVLTGTGSYLGTRELLAHAVGTVTRHPVVLGICLVLGAAGGFARIVFLAPAVDPVLSWAAVPIAVLQLTLVVVLCRYVAPSREDTTSTVRARLTRSTVAVASLLVTLLAVAGVTAAAVTLELPPRVPSLVKPAITAGLAVLLTIHLPVLIPAIAIDGHGPLAASVAAWRSASGYRFQILSIDILVAGPTVAASWSLGSFYGPAFAVVSGITGLLAGIGLVAFCRIYVKNTDTH